MAAPQDNSTHSSTATWLLVLLLGAILLGLVAYNIASRSNTDSAKGQDEAALAEVESGTPGAVTMAMEIAGEPDQEAREISFRPGQATFLLDAMKQIAPRHAAWEFEYSRERENAMLTRLAGRENEGAGGRNWLFEVNGEMAQKSFGAYRLRPGDQVLWKFAPNE